MRYICNPINFGYKYQFNRQPDGEVTASREAADPSMILFQGKYFIYPSMTCGFLYSDDLAEWKYHPVKNLPVYDYAPDVRAVGDYLYFCASNHEKGTYYRTKDPFSDEYEKIEGDFPFWDPNLFADEDGRLYFYWGSSTSEPIYGIELDAETMKPVGERQNLFYGNDEEKGFERTAENHVPLRSKEEIEAIISQMDVQQMPESVREAAISYIKGSPYVEGAWMNKHGGRYYLQYGTPSSGCNIYGDAVYVSDKPLGPFMLAKSNPYSYHPGGFFPGAGHGSTMEDREGNVWHTSTMRICVNHNFERRIGLWRAGWDKDGELFCNQRYGDWVMSLDKLAENPWADPDWMLLSYQKAAKASSSEEGKGPELAVNEDVRNWWRAASNESGQWIQVDLGDLCDIHAVQINFADDKLCPPLPEGAELTGALHQERWIDEIPQKTRWRLEASADGTVFFTVEDKSKAETDLPHDLVVREEGFQARYIRLTVEELPYGQAACVSGLRVFGLAHGEVPHKAVNVSVKREGDLDMQVSWKGKAVGYVVQWGTSPEKLYHSYMVFADSVRIGALVKGQENIYVRVDSFNESGITEGDVVHLS
ncbi:MAG: family 43 glycosylhydrolase [Acetatifactor sp.]|nr:family 43 glycosylhydrolase [Acetatifactor sp.]